MKRIFALFVATTLIASLSIPVSATTANKVKSNEAKRTRNLERVFDIPHWDDKKYIPNFK